MIVLQDTQDSTAASAGAVEKAFIVLESFAPAGGTFGVTELARRSGLSKTTTHRVLGALTNFGLVERRGGGYTLGRRLHELATMADDTQLGSLREVLLPYLQELHERTGETVQLAALSGDAVLYLDKVCGHRSMNVPTRVGSRVPAYRTVVGRLLLAHAHHDSLSGAVRSLHSVAETTGDHAAASSTDFDRIRNAGFASGRHEVVTGAVCLAAPILGQRRDAVAAISLTGPAGRLQNGGAHLAVRNVAHRATTAIRRFTATQNRTAA
jgi:IclR family transcriptional regulator, KDG regulon repressor